MAEFKISRFRYTWRGNWTTGTSYLKDDIVRYGGSSFVCVRQHTADSNFYDDLYYVAPGDTAQSPSWVKMADGYVFRGDWAPSTSYNLGDIVSQGGVLYLCTTAHSTVSFITDDPETEDEDESIPTRFDAYLSNWTVYSSQISFTGDWQVNTRYSIGDVVKYNGIVYRCIEGHWSSTTDNGLEIALDPPPPQEGEPAESPKWQILNSGVEFVGAWDTGQRYKVNDLVKYGGTLWRCKEGHTSGTDSTLNFDSEEHWNLELPGFQYSSEWSNSVVYQTGDIVRHGGYLFYCLNTNYNDNPSSNIYQTEDRNDPLNWRLVVEGTNFRGVWNQEESYKTGDVVRRGGNLYQALLDTSISSNDGSTQDYLDSTNWKIIIPGQNYRGNWESSETYSINDLVIFKGSTYQCNFAHVSSSDNFPSDNGSGFFYWDLLLKGSDIVGMRSRGDLLTYNLSRSLAGDGSSFGPTDVSIGQTGELLTINQDGDVFYRNLSAINRVFYVAPDGEDDTTNSIRGSQFAPFKTIRFACEVADDGFNGTTTVEVSAGEFEEVLPIIVPKKTAIVGSELRTTTVKPNPPYADLAQDRQYTIAALNRISSIIPSILAGTTVTKTTGNPLNPVVISEQVDLGGGVLLDQVLETDPDAATDIQDLISDITRYINFYLASTGTEPTLVGNNTPVTSSGYVNAVTVLEENKEFLAEEAVRFVQVTYPSYSFDSVKCKRDIRNYIDAWKYDIIYTGNYKSILAARYYRNAVLGSQSEDMFYMRDATGLRNMTLKGLSGQLTPPNVFDLYRLPTGRSFVSLDPGWGPNDTRVWITTRSPYIQGVTNIGTGCVGQKIDGALHNGGNRSMVSNDFTQVISDGVGAWVSNQGRAELVSVFTYYCHVGYLSTNGGIIRGTNGNCSYGRFGAIADGIDDTETPKSAEIFNRNQEAIVSSVIAGDFTDDLKIFEFTNAGQNYTTASASIIGSGVNASVVFEDFRDDAIFESRKLDTSTTFSQSVGGGGYLVVGNNAQLHSVSGGDLTSIKIASNDPNSITEYLGMRIILTAGPGTGQYGYITAYDNVEKIVSVSRESDDQPGWDHVIPGTPVETLLTQATSYRIEPRPIFQEAPFVSSNSSVSTHNYISVAYGEVTVSYNNRTGGAPTGVVIEDDGLTLLTATFNVTRLGRSYTVTLNNPGAGYEQDQILTIPGTDLGGISPRNDITIVVTRTSEDSTNRIEEFTYSGEATSGMFVSLTNTNEAIYSTDGETWNETTLPSSGEWKSVASGNNRFVAIRYNSSSAAYSLNGITWTARTLPASRLWNSVVYGNGKFVAVAGNLNAGAYSSDGITWSSMTMPTVGDSAVNEWVDITYGKGKFVAVANSGNIAAYSTDGISWTGTVMDVIADSSQKDWVSIAYGNNRYVAISSQGDIGYSFDGEDWLSGGSLPTQDGSTVMNWKKIRYGQGVFFAVCDTGSKDIGADPTTGPTTFAATSTDGIVWTSRELSASVAWRDIAIGRPFIDSLDSTVGKSTPTWISVGIDTNQFCKIRTGATAKGRVSVSAGVISELKLWDPGSGYFEPPSVTLIDPNNTSDAAFENRIADGVLSQPSWINRGFGYRTSSTTVSITGDGFADVIPVGKFITITALPAYPGPGAQITFTGNDTRYTIVTVESVTANVGGDGFSARLRVSPEMKVRDKLEHGTIAEIRELYSQVRITGHDFLDIGTGNFIETNYPDIYQTGLYVPAPENEVIEEDGGRVFYTSTDQSGNFRTGELFAVEQATGIVTISADFFDLSGLTELQLGGIRIGGSGAVIREFSTDATFTADSNNIIPTQRAIKAYLNNRLTVGGSEIATANFIAGTVRVGPDLIASTLSSYIYIPVRADFDQEFSGISGSMLAQTMFHRSFSSDL